MVAGPGDNGATDEGGCGRLRASHADREQVIEVLKAAFVQGRLDGDELDARVGQAFASRTYAELADLTADIPAASVATPPPAARPARRRVRSPQSQGYKAAVGAFAALWACLLAGLEIAPPAGNPVVVLAGWVVFTTFCALVVGALLLLHSRLDKHAGAIPSGPDPGGPGLEGQRSAAIGHDPAQHKVRRDQTRADLRAHIPSPGRPHSPRRDSRAPRRIRPVPDAV